MIHWRWVACLVLATATSPVLAEVIEMKNGQLHKGEVLTFFEDGYVIRAGGQDQFLPKDEIASIKMNDAPPTTQLDNEAAIQQEAADRVIGKERGYLLEVPTSLERQIEPRFSTPQNTFKTWKKAAEHGDVQSLVDCYAETFRKVMDESLRAMTSEQLDAMAKETRLTKFKVERIVFKGAMAFARITRVQGDSSDLDVLNFVKERGQWKLVP